MGLPDTGPGTRSYVIKDNIQIVVPGSGPLWYLVQTTLGPDSYVNKDNIQIVVIQCGAYWYSLMVVPGPGCLRNTRDSGQDPIRGTQMGHSWRPYLEVPGSGLS